MEVKRYEGTLKKWNPERGFGFVTAADGGLDIFVHISAFARGGRVPSEGELLTFEVEPDRNGKRSAVRVRRAGDSQLTAVRAVRADSRGVNAANKGLGGLQKLMVVLLVVALAAFAYDRYAARVARTGAPAPGTLQPAAPVLLSGPTRPAPARFSCDGRSHCSQMSTCEEATWFLKNCPGMSMDGDGDGVPCEQQLCSH